MHELGAMQRDAGALRQQLLANNAAAQVGGGCDLGLDADVGG